MKEDTDADRAATRDMPPHSRIPIADGLHNPPGTLSTGRLEVRCPNCHAPTEVAVDTALTDLTCSACGSHFSLVDQSKATRMAPSLSKLGRFELIERLGVGGFGSVWKARDKELDRTVAIKIPRAGGMTSEEQEKFFREARAAAQLRHPRIVSVHEVGRDGDSVYIVSDFVRGVTLGDWLSGQKLTSREAADVCAKIADALHHAHEQGVVHRDLKPANILMDYDGEPHLMDFGLARRESGEISITIDGQVLGTPAYMSPEQAQGEAHTADRRSDVYSLGVILFQLLTGELPFRGNARMLIKQVIQDEPPSPRKLNANVSKDLETITLKCLEKEPARRYQTAQEIESELGRFLSGEPIRSRPIGRFARSWRWTKRNPRIAILAASVAILLVTVAALSTVGFVIAKRQQLAAQEAAAREANLRTLAEENLGLAEQAVDGYLTRVAEDERLKQDDFHGLRTELLETAVPFYERFAKQKPGDAKSQANQANAYARLASIHGELGEHQRSVREYEQAIKLRNELAFRFSDASEYRRDLAHDECEMGWELHVVAKTAEARPHYDSALAILTKLVDEFPKEPNYRQMLAKTHERYGMLVRYADAADGQKHFERAIDLERVLVKEFPEVPDYKAGLASSSFYLGHLLRKTQPQAAHAYLSEAASIQRKLTALRPKDPEYRIALGEYIANLGCVLCTLGDAKNGRQQYDESIEILKQVVAQFPSVVKYRVILKNSYWNYADSLAQIGDWASAVPQYEQSLVISEKLANDFPSVPAYAADACAIYIACGKLLQKMGDQGAAEKHFERAFKLAADFPSNDQTTQYAVSIHNFYISSAQQRGDQLAVANHTKSIIAIKKRHAEAVPENPVAWNDYAQALINPAALQNGDITLAVEAATKACEVSKYNTAYLVENLAYTHRLARNFTAMKENYQRGLALYGKLLESKPNDRNCRRDIAEAENGLAGGLAENRELAASCDHLKQALVQYETLASDFPSDRSYAESLVQTHKWLAANYEQQDDWANAKTHWEKALKIYDARLSPASQSIFASVLSSFVTDPGHDELARALAKINHKNSPPKNAPPNKSEQPAAHHAPQRVDISK